ncbi:unnamed protein product, partial [Prorocentrum cordatum]
MAEAAAPPAGPRCGAAGAGEGGLGEWRVDEADGCAYQLEDFLLEYGGCPEKPPSQWLHAPAAGPAAVEEALERLRCEGEGEGEDMEDDGGGEEPEESSEDEEEDAGPAPAPPPWLPAVVLAAEAVEALSGFVDAMRYFGIEPDESAVGPGSLGAGGALAAALAEARRALLREGGGLALLRGVPWPAEAGLRRSL